MLVRRKRGEMAKKKSDKIKNKEEDRKERLRKILLSKRDEVLKEAKEEIGKFIRGENKEIIETALDDGDWSIVDVAEDLNLRKLTLHKQTLNKIEEALRKIDEGTYGICEDCGSEIPEERLKVIPFAIYCVDCMETREKLEEIDKEEW
jgi:DnaK suppressor protein